MNTTPSVLTEAHREWATRPADQRFQTLEELFNRVNTRRAASRAMDVDAEKIVAGNDSDGRLLINGTIQPSTPTHWSFGQLSSMIQAPAAYLRTLPLPLMLPLLNHGIRTGTATGAVKFMTVQPDSDEPAVLQAVTSTTYGRIWDAEVVSAIMRLVDRSGGQWHNPPAYNPAGGPAVPSGLYASDHDIFCFLIDGGSFLEAGPRAKLSRGFFARNSETCARSFGLTTFFHNGVCGNHFVWGASEVNKLIVRHTAGGPGRFDSEAMPTLKGYLEASPKPIEEAIRKAQQLKITDGNGNPEPWLLANGKFSRGEIKAAVMFAKAEEGQCETAWDAIQGLTASARAIEWVDARIDLETRAGRLMDVVTATRN